MFIKQLNLFTIFGFRVRLDLSWFVVLALLVWSLAAVAFPRMTEGQLSGAAYAIMGVIGALALFGSVLLHELGHALVARRYGLPIRGITLFIFGGVAEMTREPQSAKVEFLVAIAGPVVSVVIAFTCIGLWMIGAAAAWPIGVQAVLLYLGAVNGIVVAFNLIPAFPLDGGRVLRSALWQWKADLAWATRITASLGAGFGLFLIALGLIELFRGDWLGGPWLMLIGLFMRSAATQSYRQVLVRQALEGEKVADFTEPAIATASPSSTIEEVLQRPLPRPEPEAVAVVEGDRLRGCLSLSDLRRTPPSERAVRRAEELLSPCDEKNSIDWQAEAIEALMQMSGGRQNRLFVVEEGRLRGDVSLEAIAEFVARKLSPDGASPPSDRPAANSGSDSKLPEAKLPEAEHKAAPDGPPPVRDNPPRRGVAERKSEDRDSGGAVFERE